LKAGKNNGTTSPSIPGDLKEEMLNTQQHNDLLKRAAMLAEAEAVATGRPLPEKSIHI
jgi:hypothetical protein